VSATLAGSDGNSFTLFSLYNVIYTTLREAGPSTVFLQLSGVTHPNPRRQCIADLNRIIAAMVANDEAVVVIGDFNEVLGQDLALMAAVCAAHSLFDVHAHGTKRVDYCVASGSLEPHVTACGFNLFNENNHSDRQASFVDFTLKVFFRHVTPSLARADMRFVSTSGPDVTKFVQKMYVHLAENKVFHQFQDFCLDVDVAAEPWRAANKIDKAIGHAFTTAGKHCYKTPKPIGMTRTFSIASYPVVFTSNRVHDDLERRGEKQKERQRDSQTSKESR
jgi:hypothetical protein